MMSKFFTGPENLRNQAQPVEVAALIWSVPDKGVLRCLFVLVQSVGKLYSSRPGWQAHFDNPLIKKNKIFLARGLLKFWQRSWLGENSPRPVLWSNQNEQIDKVISAYP